MKLKIKLFAYLAEECGFQEKEIEVPEGTDTEALGDILTRVFPCLANYDDYIMLAVNENLVRTPVMLGDGDVVSVFPPVAGG